MTIGRDRWLWLIAGLAMLRASWYDRPKQARRDWLCCERHLAFPPSGDLAESGTDGLAVCGGANTQIERATTSYVACSNLAFPADDNWAGSLAMADSWAEGDLSSKATKAHYSGGGLALR